MSRSDAPATTALRIDGAEFIPRFLAFLSTPNLREVIQVEQKSEKSRLKILPTEITETILQHLQESLCHDEQGPWVQFEKCLHGCNAGLASCKSIDHVPPEKHQSFYENRQKLREFQWGQAPNSMTAYLSLSKETEDVYGNHRHFIKAQKAKLEELATSIEVCSPIHLTRKVDSLNKTVSKLCHRVQSPPSLLRRSLVRLASLFAQQNHSTVPCFAYPTRRENASALDEV